MKKIININLDSKNTLAKQLSSKKLADSEARLMIERVIKNHDLLWKDNITASNPEKGKWVRSAYRTELGKLLKLIDQKVLSPLDDSLPNFVFGGRRGMSNITAAKSLLGYDKERTLLALDITKFFESVERSKVEAFYYSKNCTPRIANTLSRLSCVPRGKKDLPETTLSLARGFSTSTRLAVWSYMTAFHRINDLVMKKLKGYDPRMAIFIDDIGISASRVPEDLLRSLEIEIDDILSYESKGAVRLNTAKTKVLPFKEGISHLGVTLNRNKLVLPSDLQSKRDWLNYQYKATKSQVIKMRLKGYRAYEAGIKKANLK